MASLFLIRLLAKQSRRYITVAVITITMHQRYKVSPEARRVPAVILTEAATCSTRT